MVKELVLTSPMGTKLILWQVNPIFKIKETKSFIELIKKI